MSVVYCDVSSDQTTENELTFELTSGAETSTPEPTSVKTSVSKTSTGLLCTHYGSRKSYKMCFLKPVWYFTYPKIQHSLRYVYSKM